jgi:diguanylate cyclase
MQLSVLIAIVVAHCVLLALGVGIARIGCLRFGRQRQSTSPKAEIAKDPRTAKRLLTRVYTGLLDHAKELQRFQHALADCPVDATLGTELGDDVSSLHEANRRVDDTLDTVASQIRTALGEQHGTSCIDFDAYQAKTRACEDSLEQVTVAPMVDDVVSRLLDVISDLREENKSLRHEVTIAKDQVVEQMSRAHAAEQMASLDILTQLPNRRAFEESLNELHAKLNGHGHCFCVVLFDVDHFKAVNDRYGHAAGDRVLALMGQLFRETKRPTDRVCRLGGEEFAVLLPKCNLDAAVRTANRYRQRIEAAKLRFEDQEIGVTISGGVSEAVPDEASSCVLRRADSALYRAKSEGRNRVCVHDLHAEKQVAVQEAAMLNAV